MVWFLTWRRIILALLIAGAIFLLALGAFAGRSWWLYLRRINEAERQIAAELERIRIAGEPITADEMFAFHQIPPGETDLTQDWINALADLHSLRPTHQQMNQLPVVGRREIEDLDPSAENSCFADAEAYLERIRPQLEAVLVLANRSGQVRFPIDFREGFLSSLPHLEQIRNAVRVLQVQARVCRIRGDMHRYEESLSAMIRVMEKLRDDPALVSQLVRRACLGQLAEELEDAASHSQLDASALSRLAHAVEAIDFNKAERIALFGERATAFQAMTKSSTDLGGESPADEAALSATAGPIDKAFTLHVFRHTIEAIELNYRDSAVMRDTLTAKFSRIEKSNPAERILHVFSLYLVPGIPLVHRAFVDAAAKRNVAVAALRIKAFRLQNGDWPRTLDDIATKGSADAVSDPYDAHPLRLKVREYDVVVYSVGDDLEDNHGNEDRHRGHVDIVSVVLP